MIKPVNSRARVLAPTTALPQFDTRSIAQGASQLGQSVRQGAEAFNRARRAGELAEAQATYLERLGTLENNFLARSDPETLREDFEREADALKTDVLEGISTADDRQAFEARFAARTVAGVRRVSQHRLRLMADQAQASTEAALEETVTAATQAASPLDRASAIESFEDLLADNTAGGLMSETQAGRFAASLTSRLANIDAQTAIEADPTAALAALKGDGFADLSPQERLRYRARAQAEIVARQRAAAHVQAQAAAGARTSLNEIDKVIGAGLTAASGLMENARAFVEASGDATLAERYNDTLLLQETQRRFTGLTPAELQAEISVMEARGTGDGAAAKTLTMARTLLGTMRRTLDKDPLSWLGRVDGFALSPLDPRTGITPEQAAARVATSATAAERYSVAPRLLTDEETAAFTTHLEGLDPDQQLGFLEGVTRAFGGSSQQLLSEISPQAGVVAHAGGLLATGGIGSRQHVSARRLLTGFKALKDNPDLKAPAPEKAQAIREVLADALGTQASTRANVIKAADALFADMVLRGEADDPEDAYESALNLAVGGDGARGGFGEINGVTVVLPTDMTEDDLESAIGNAPDSALVAASEGGGIPHHSNGDRFTANELRDARLIAIGDGRYFVNRDPRDPNSRILGSGVGGFYVLDARKLFEVSPKNNLLHLTTVFELGSQAPR